MKNIKNISIVAHINHGKSTLATRLTEICKKIKKNTLNEQLLDSMDLEKERGITIKAQCLTLTYEFNEIIYTLNIIDTPGHIDFSFEVNRSLIACQGIVLLIDITKGIQAQTLSNYKKALDNNLKTLIAINKIDVIDHGLDELKNEIVSIFNVKKVDIIEISAKTGYGVENLIKRVITTINDPEGLESTELEAIIIDAWFNQYTGINCLINIKNGIISKNDKILMISSKKIFKVIELGIFCPEKISKDNLKAGDIGFIIFGCKNLNEIKIGDTITHLFNQTKNTIHEIKKINPSVYASIYPIISDNFTELKTSIEKLSLNDSSFEYTIQNSNVFGFGFKCGFLGILHMEIIQERLEREYNQTIIITPPSVIFEVIYKNDKKAYINNPNDITDISQIKEMREPIAIVRIITQIKYLGKVTELCNNSRGKIKEINTRYEDTIIEYEIPLNEIIFNFFKKLQNITSGFCSFDYEFLDYKTSNLTTLAIMINNKKIDALEFIIHKDNAYKTAKNIIEKMEKIIQKQLFEIKIQAVVGKKIIAKSSIKALKKNVLAKCYGGDISRKKKLIKKQKEGKKRLKKIGNIEIPQNAFLSIMNINNN
ncbi:MAG TPA: translation elongation factor 4 [Candidatus Azoamicus sp.]